MSTNDVPEWLAERLESMTSGEIARAVRALQQTAARRTPSTSPSTSPEPEPTKVDAAELAKIIRERMPY